MEPSQSSLMRRSMRTCSRVRVRVRVRSQDQSRTDQGRADQGRGAEALEQRMTCSEVLPRLVAAGAVVGHHHVHLVRLSVGDRARARARARARVR